VTSETLEEPAAFTEAISNIIAPRLIALDR
jgi:hypothetical protein